MKLTTAPIAAFATAGLLITSASQPAAACGGGGRLRIGNGAPQVTYKVKAQLGVVGQKGPVDKKTAQRTVRRNLAGIRHCYSRVARQEPWRVANLELRWRVLASGRTTAITIASTNGPVGRLRGCVSRRIARWRFPPAEAATVMTVALDLRMEGPFVRRPTETIAAFALAPTLSDQSRDRLLAAWKAAGGQVEADALIARFAGSLGTSPRDAARLLWLLRADRDALAHRQLHRRAARRLLNSKAYPGFAKHVKEQLARLQTLSAKSRVGYRGPET